MDQGIAATLRLSKAENLENLTWQATMFKIGASERKPTHCIALAALRDIGWFLMMLSFGRARPRCR